MSLDNRIAPLSLLLKSDSEICLKSDVYSFKCSVLEIDIIFGAIQVVNTPCLTVLPFLVQEVSIK